MADLKSICVYCGAGNGENPAYAEAASNLGAAIAGAGIRLVYGGGSIGLMGRVARAALDAGGEVTGIIPRFLEKREEMFTDVSDLVVTEDMHERKMLMFDKAEAFVALPGGIGTLEELVEQMTWIQLGQHKKPVLLANIAQFWQPLIELLDHMREEQFIRQAMDVSYLVTDRVSDIVPMLQRAVADMPAEEVDLPAEAEQIRRL
ncbi:MAG TPA: TIGR00730 family Rossman fold protein [Afifellaceae bacterium]|nr:TIGR00730 family Rossman fold protein [Afifellaceae bacterium]